MSDRETNRIFTGGWSNYATRAMYNSQWRKYPEIKAMHDDGKQCGGCSWFAPLGGDFGLCLCMTGPNWSETIFEHYTCVRYVYEGWGPHSFCDDPPTAECDACGEPL